MRHVLFFFPHPDDEVFAQPSLKRELRAGANVLCYFLTDGLAKIKDPSVRKHESLRILKKIGVLEANTHFIGVDHHLPDGQLFRHLDRAYSAILSELPTFTPDAIYCPAWEGGHQDHDSTTLLALAFAQERGSADRCYQYYTYNGSRTPGPFFSVARPIYKDALTIKNPVSLREAWSNCLSCFHYPSQWKSWLGLAPFYVLKTLLGRTEILNPTTVATIQKPPHAGPPLYERRGDPSFAEFFNLTSSFMKAHGLLPSKNPTDS